MPTGIGAAVSIGSSIAGPASSIAGGILGSNAAGDAAKAAQQAAAQNNAFNQNLISTNTQNLNPFIQSGQAANTELAGLLGTGGNAQAANDAFQKYLGSTNYQFQLGQGLQGIEYANAPSFNSGATAKALNNYAQGQAAGALGGYENLLVGQGQQGAGASGTLGSLSNQLAQLINANTITAANVTGAAGQAQANDIIGALNGITGESSQAGSQSSFGGQGLSSLPGSIGTLAGSIGKSLGGAAQGIGGALSSWFGG